MTYVVTEACIRCKIMDCVDVCPVDCFYEGENMLVIHPDECIDCGVCVPECPVDAIKPDTEPGLEKWLSLNAEYAKIWPNITVKKAPPPDSKECEGRTMPQFQRLSSVIPFAAIERPACPKCKAQMMLVSIEPARARGVDLHTFECAVCNQVLTTFAAFEDPMKSKGLGRYLQGDL